MSERWKLILLVSAFLLAFFLPIETPRVQGALLEGFFLLKDYAREHVLLCLVPAFFIAGAIGQFVSQGAVLRYLGAKAPRPVAYGVASVSGSIPRPFSSSITRFGNPRLNRPPSGITPCSTQCHNAIAILRATPTIATRRPRLFSPRVLCENHPVIFELGW